VVLRNWLVGPSCTLAFVSIVGPVWSLPFASERRLVDILSVPLSQQIAYRTCTIQGGVRRCRWVSTYGPGSYGYKAPVPGPPASYGYRDNFRSTDPNELPIGSGSWWRGMDREDRGGSHPGN
jgi:hypothetical protein